MNTLDERTVYDDPPRARRREVSEYGRGVMDDRGSDREISLGTGTILGIFFGLALVCAVFFGFGYSMGRKSAQPTVVAADGAPSRGIFSSFKPAPGSPAAPAGMAANKSQAPPTQPAADPSETQYQVPPVTENAAKPRQAQSASVFPAPASNAAGESPAPAPARAPAQTVAPYSVPQTASGDSAAVAMPAISPNGTIMVQIAAVSHQEDADVLLSALKQRGYAVIVRQEAQDRLMHVQVGPFATRKDADMMRQRLLADGYNAIVK